MSVVFFAQLMFGNVFVIRTLCIFNDRALIRTSTLTKIGTTTLCMQWIALFFTSHSLLLNIFVTISASITLVLGLCIQERREIDAHKSRVPAFIDRWVLGLRLGYGVNAARDAALREESETFSALVKPCLEIRKNIRNRHEHPLFSASILREFEQIALAPHCALARLENLREMSRKASDFRRRSGQAVRQSAIQSAVMLVLLLALTVFTVHRYGWSRISDLILGSVLLSLAGVWLMTRLARKTRWTV